MIVRDRAIRGLNRRFRGHDRATDVLSFPQMEGTAPAVARRLRGRRPRTGGDGRGAAAAGDAGRLLGDIVISLDTARRQAHKMGLAPGVRLRQLLIHGFLHLLGYDHERSADEARRMFARERELATALAGTRAPGGARVPPARRRPRAPR